MRTKARHRWVLRLLAMGCLAPVVQVAALPVALAQAPAQGAPVAIVLALDPDSALDGDTVRAAIARELGVTLTSDPEAPGGMLVVQEMHGHAAVSFTSPQGKRETRDVKLPDDADEAAHDIALVAVNLAKDQASAFIHPAAPAQPPAAPSSSAPAPAAANAKKTAPALPGACDREGPFALAGFDVLPYLGTPRRRNISIGMVGTLSNGLHGAGLGSAFNVDTDFVCGVQIAGALNVAGGPVSGGQLAGALNVGAQGVSGTQMAGALNISGALHGAQIAGAANVATSVSGAQVAGGLNVTGPMDGAQVAGGLNVATGVSGAQIAPVNIASGEVHGVQIGVVNVAKNADFALGVVNVMTHGRFHVDAWGAPDTGLLFAGVKNGGAHFHSIYGVGLRATDLHRAWATLGFGVHVTPMDSLYVDVDVLGNTELVFDTSSRNTLYQGRIVVGYRLVPGLSIFGGPTYNVLEREHQAPTGIAPGYASLFGTTSDAEFRGWPGVVLGIEGL